VSNEKIKFHKNVFLPVKKLCNVWANTICILSQLISWINLFQFVRGLNDDRMNINGNKLRTYRLYKTSDQTEHYVSCQLPRTTRRTMALFRSGALPLAVETGRYSRRKSTYKHVCNYYIRSVYFTYKFVHL
jgi:hypothetical protein